MKPTVPDDGSIQQQIGTAYDVVKSVADNLPAILAVTQAVEDAQEVIADISEQVQLATNAANNATQVVGTIEGLKTASENARDLAEDYRDAALIAKNDAISAQTVVVPLAADFQTKWPIFTSNYADIVSKYGLIVGMHDDVDADRIAAETARSKAEAWANTAVDVVVEAGKFSGVHWATKASGFNILAQGYAGTANQKAGEANQSAIDANSAAGIAGDHATTATNKAVDANNAAGVALGHANTALGYKDQTWTFREQARGYAEDAAAIVGGDFVPRSTTINGLPLSGNIALTAAQLTDLVPAARTVNNKALSSNITLGVGDIADAAKTDGTNATGTWPITAAKANTLLKVLQSSDTGASNAAMYCKILRVTLNSQYHEYTGFLAVIIGNSGSGIASTEFLSVRVKQQTAFGNNPNIDCTSMILTTPYNGVVFGYTIIQNTPTTIVDFYIQTNTGWTTADISVLQEKMSGTDASRIWYNQDVFVASVSGFVAGTRNFAVKTTDTTNKVLWANLVLSTSISNLQTQLENANLGYLRKTAASTYVVETTIPIASVSGTVPVNKGGTGVITLTGMVKGNGTSAFSAAVPGTDYVIPSGSITGNAATASKLAAVVQINGVDFDGSGNITIPAPGSVATADALTTTRAITATGDADWTVNFKGDAPVTAALTLKNVVTAATGIKITYNAKGLVTGSSGLLASDIPNLDWAKITTGVPSFALQSDARFTDSREWTATTAVLVDITGANATRKAYTGAVIKAAIEDIAAPKTSTDDRITALESAPDSAALAKKALAIAIIGL